MMQRMVVMLKMMMQTMVVMLTMVIVRDRKKNHCSSDRIIYLEKRRLGEELFLCLFSSPYTFHLSLPFIFLFFPLIFIFIFHFFFSSSLLLFIVPIILRGNSIPILRHTLWYPNDSQGRCLYMLSLYI